MEYTQLKDIITDTNNNNRHLYNFMIQNPTYDYKVIIELALMYKQLDLVKMTLDYHDQNTKEFWNDLLVNAAVINDLTLAKYCIKEGATNLAECFYCAKNYKNDELANYFVGAVNRNKENIDINSLYDNKQHALIYEYFS